MRHHVGSRARGGAALLAVFVLAVPVRAQVGAPVTIVDANTASESDLAPLPNMGPVIAAALVAERPFLRTADLDAFLAGQALDADQRRALYDRTFVHINLNVASDAETPPAPPRVHQGDTATGR